MEEKKRTDVTNRNLSKNITPDENGLSIPIISPGYIGICSLQEI